MIRTVNTLQEAYAIADPKNIWVNGDKIIVSTGTDMPPGPSQDDKDAAAAGSYAKLTALKSMTPAQVQAWVSANVTTLAGAQDAIMTLAIAVSILARRI